MRAFRRADGGGLVETKNVGDVFQEYVPPVVSLYASACFPERRVDLGIFGLDLDREEKASGVPPWFCPNASRRRRRGKWWALTSLERVERKPRSLFESLAIRTLVGHRYAMRFEVADLRERSGKRAVTFEALLYLPEGEKATKSDEETLRCEFLGALEREVYR